MTRRGFTLVELMIALVLMGIVSIAIYRVLNQQQRVSTAQAEQMGLQSGVRTIASIAGDELRELGASATASDLVSIAANSVTYRAMRGTGFACYVTDNEIRILRSSWSGMRLPAQNRDSLLLFVEGDPSVSTDDRWQSVPVQGISLASSCGGGAPAIRISTQMDTTVATGTPLTSIELNAPVRDFEIMQLAPLVQGTQTFLGARSVVPDQPLQPVAGPLAGNGLVFSYLDSLGTPTALLTRVRTIQLQVRGVSDRPVYAGGGQSAAGPQLLQDSTVATVTLRNTPHP